MSFTSRIDYFSFKVCVLVRLCGCMKAEIFEELILYAEAEIGILLIGIEMDIFFCS